MRISFGKHDGSLLEAILLTDPRYIHWMLGVERRAGSLQCLYHEACRLIRLFDEKPLQKICQGYQCGKPATRLGLANDGYEINSWCDDCQPRAIESYGTKVEVVKDYLSALYLEIQSPKEAFEAVTPLLALAYAKGLKEHPRDDDLEEFFGTIFGLTLWRRKRAQAIR